MKNPETKRDVTVLLREREEIRVAISRTGPEFLHGLVFDVKEVVAERDEARRALVELAEAASLLMVAHDDEKAAQEPMPVAVERLRTRLTEPRTREAVRAASGLSRCEKRP